MEEITAEDFIKILESLEPVFAKAGQLALKMQAGVHHHDKLHTGNEIIDIVTDADLAVQEFLLKEFVATPLVNCCLLGEEKTALVEKFNPQGKYFICIDPIDGTLSYASGSKQYSTIITFHDGKNVLYLYNHFPALGITHKIVNGVYTRGGEDSEQMPGRDLSKSILYWGGNPEKNISEAVIARLKAKNIVFEKIDNELRKALDIINSFSFDRIAGVYKENPNVSTGKENNSNLNLSVNQQGDYGINYPGYYLVLNDR